MGKLKVEEKSAHRSLEFDARQIQRAEKVAPISSAHPPYSWWPPASNGAVFPYAGEHRIGVDRYSHGFRLLSVHDTGTIASLPRMTGGSAVPIPEPLLSRNLRLSRRCVSLHRHSATPGEVACMDIANPAVTGAIVVSAIPGKWMGVAEARRQA